MQDDIAIKVDNVSKTFRLPHEKQNSIKGSLISMVRGGKRSYEKQQVLKNISFEIKKGEFFGIVGRNGSGKSTLLKMLAGVYSPSKGHIQVNGKLTPFIELGVGFNPELTGRENVFLNGALLGFSRKEMLNLYDDIVDFAELHKFMDQKLKNYSSGMQVRLAFSIAIRARSDILVLDEVLAVGDAIFQKKCFDYFKDLKKNKQTVVFVSHDTGALQEYCDRGVLIENGDIIFDGNIDSVISRYIDVLNKQEADESSERKQGNIHHAGSGDAKVTSIQTLNEANKPADMFTDTDKFVVIETHYKASVHIDEPIYGITVNDAAGQRIFAGNNYWSHKTMNPLQVDESIVIRWKLPNVFSTGSFTITPAIAGSGGTVMFDQVDGMGRFKVRKKQISNAYTNLNYSMEVV